MKITNLVLVYFERFLEHPLGLAIYSIAEYVLRNTDALSVAASSRCELLSLTV